MTDRRYGRREALGMLGRAAGLAAVGGLAEACSSSSGGSASRPRARSTTSTTAARRLLGPGDRPDPTKPEGIDLLPEVEHIVIYMQENHSYDNVFGMLGRGDGFTLDGAGRPRNANPGADGRPVRVFHESDTSNSRGSSGPSWKTTRRAIHGGAMDGFAAGDPETMGYYDRTDLPYYYGLAEHFVVCDRWFASCPAPTYPNRRFLQAATSVGVTFTDIQEILATPDAPNGVIWERLDAHGISWRDYAYDLPDLLLFPNFHEKHKDKVHTIGQFLTDCRQGTLPAVSIVSPGRSNFSEESQDSQRGEAYTALLVDAVLGGKAWEHTVMFLTYDEHGGWYDHVRPPAAVAPDDIALRLRPGDPPGRWDSYGIRVPSVVISPFAKKGYVSHVVHDHTSVLRFIETKFNLGALTRRDANASDLLDTLDIAVAAFREPPELPKPALPDGVSRFQPDGAPLPTPA